MIVGSRHVISYVCKLRLLPHGKHMNDVIWPSLQLIRCCI